MAGYTPLFSSLTTGTLCGKWPDIGLWPIVLSMADKDGRVDCTPAYISGVTGLPLTDVIDCMRRFCEPDPGSRSNENDGARLALLDDHRDWGWRVVNHGLYREKARKVGYDIARTASGRDAERKRIERERSERPAMSRRVPTRPDASRDVPTRPDASRDVPLSYSDSDSDAEKNRKVPTEPMSATPTGPRETPDQPDRTGEAVARVFKHWREVHGHPKASLDAKRRKLIRNALLSYHVDDLCESISGYLNSPHHMGQNSNATKYDDIGLLLRDATHIDAGLTFARAPPRTDLSEKTRKIIAQTEDWQPPEVRHASR